MNLIMETCFKVLLVGWFIISASFAANAQKLPKVQTESVYAPANIKIDGKPTEWDGKFQAYNVSNHLFYTLSNDDKNLYLIIHTSAVNTINKIYVGGITFTVNSLSHLGKLPVSITYPVIRGINNAVYMHANDTYREYKKDSIANAQNITDLIHLKNEQFNSIYNELRTSGIKEGDDPFISVYNTDGIKVRALFDSNFAYTYELALPLKYLGQVLDSADKLIFDIKLNGNDRGNGRFTPNPPRAFRPDGSEIINMDNLYVTNPTDFKGQYTLAKR